MKWNLLNIPRRMIILTKDIKLLLFSIRKHEVLAVFFCFVSAVISSFEVSVERHQLSRLEVEQTLTCTLKKVLLTRNQTEKTKKKI